MVFSSTIFLFLFFPALFFLYYNPFFKGRKFRNIVLLIASLFFYAWGEPVFVFLMIISIIISWFLGLLLQKNHSKVTLSIGILYYLLILFIFKYLSFFASQLGILLNKDFSFIDIALPIGISFFSFQLMSYLFDIYYGKVNAQRNPLYVGLYISFFPQLIAGPIIRYNQIEKEIVDRTETKENVICGMQRFIYGLAKKVLIANYIAQIADNIFYLKDMSVLTAWFGAIVYTLQIYFDFSGYSDMAIGLGRIFGFHFPENFNYPYIAKSITEFWRRWHISLSTWFRDYVYIPLGGNRVKKSRWVLNLFVVWLLTGIWHGANWTFILWGLIYFAFLLMEKLTGFSKKIGRLSHIYTLVVVILAWVIFRSDSISCAGSYIGKMFGIGSKGFCDATFLNAFIKTKGIVIIGIVAATPLFKKLIGYLRLKKLEFIENIWIIIIFIASLLQIISSSYNPFIYFNF